MLQKNPQKTFRGVSHFEFQIFIFSRFKFTKGMLCYSIIGNKMFIFLVTKELNYFFIFIFECICNVVSKRFN